MSTSAGFPLLDALRSILSEKKPFCNGTLGLSARGFVLYYGQGRDACQLDLSGTTADHVQALDELERACEAATFGRNQETVLDESYRRAGKMDVENFVSALDVEKCGLLDVVRAGLLTGKQEDKPVRTELYKLNVYGKDAFFKAHKDTPRGTDVFGSLVIIFPTPHEGGALVLRHEGQEWTFDAAQILATSASTPAEALKRIAYIAFFSDVEHEVLPVTSGHRVTLTYNLYWGSPPLPRELTVFHPTHSNEADLKNVLEALLNDSEFLPDGGTLGFYLRHKYPFPHRWESRMPNPLETLQGWLKGSDAALWHASKALGLAPFLRLIHHSYEGSVMLATMVNLGYLDDSSEADELCNNHDGVRIIDRRFAGDKQEDDKMEDSDADYYSAVEVHWVTEDQGPSSVCSEYIAYGNEASTNLLYMTVALLVDVGPAGRRGDTKDLEGVGSFITTQ
ncbi:hypothetical protein C8Q76DRAFT_72977 [Earliella scabrosa]|nr:hypothetical protein C8Q76DRAFT_72977 [Earliella scabrosa]